MNKRQYLIQLGLAKPGKGRFSAEGQAAIELAISQGIKFDEPVAKPVSDKPKKVAKAPVVKAPDKSLYDAKVVRRWAEQNNMVEKGKRGRLPAPVIKAYLEAKGKKTLVTPKAPVKAVEKTRTVTVGYTYARRRATDPSFISEPLVAIANCGHCNKGVAYCGCTNGPVAPKYLGGERLMMERPAA